MPDHDIIRLVIKMANIIVEHRWKEHNKAEAFKVVGSIVDMAKNGKLPAGFTLKSINVIGQEDRAVCNWEAPSVGDMQNLLKSVNPPTKHEVYAADKIF
ncbi:hypothetical protein Thermo_00683 [Thermoplasmatales archaeon]|nr:hypothetical protein Thermo_00683 [Thermoplasmatales archaeon]